MFRSLCAAPFLILLATLCLVACGGSSDVSEDEAADVITKRVLATSDQEGVKPAECARSEDDSRSFDCRVEPFLWSSATATVAITVSESGDTFVVNRCEALKAESKELERIQKDPCRLIR